MALNLTQKLICSRLAEGEPVPGAEIALRVDQVLLQDVLGVLAMLEFEAMGLDRVRVGLAAQYVDHNLVQTDHMNADEHLFLRSACRRFGVWYSRPGNGISHPVHFARFGKPGDVLVGSDSHTPAAGAMGMLAFGAGGADVALAMAGEPLRLRMPQVRGIRLTGALPDWVSAKDVVLAMLRRHGTEGGTGWIFEYYGPGLEGLSAMDRHVIANMGAEMGCTTTVFPADEAVRAYLGAEGREADFVTLAADPGGGYDADEELDLSSLEPLIALPSSPGNVVPVREVAGREIYQAYVGSSANPGYRDFAVVAEIVRGRTAHDRVSLDINPSSRQVLANLAAEGHVASLAAAGARLHQAGCNGCIGMGQAPATGRISLRTVPRNFPGRSGTREDSVYLCSPETAAASALTGVITDPRTLGMSCPRVVQPAQPTEAVAMLLPPMPAAESKVVPLEKTENIASIPDLDPVPDALVVPVGLKVGDDISTDDVVPAGNRAMPYWSNIPRLGGFVYEGVDAGYPDRARASLAAGGHAIIAGSNYGQGSSRENAALAPRHLGLRVVLARSFARIHWQNLINFGVVPLTFADPSDYDRLGQGEVLRFEGLHAALRAGPEVTAQRADGSPLRLRHTLSPRQVELLLAGGVINWLRDRLAA
ncbi:aconitate hydratase [Muricoccus vinaceus]|uniref:Aconitate hydratase n=1 Tax=Muricoccus vinaceus TaxID=424704 RepID=A0ABV6IVQ6_9PROT